MKVVGTLASERRSSGQALDNFNLDLAYLVSENLDNQMDLGGRLEISKFESVSSFIDLVRESCGLISGANSR